MTTINLNEMNLTSISSFEMIEINGGTASDPWAEGFNAGKSDGFSAGKGASAGLVVIGIVLLFFVPKS